MDNHQLSLQEFCTCFRKQFIFQNGKGNMRAGKYFTALNRERGLNNDKWGIMVFLYVAPLYGFNDEQIQQELNIRDSLFTMLKYKVDQLLTKECKDQLLHTTLINKIALVKNSIKNEYRVIVN